MDEVRGGSEDGALSRDEAGKGGGAGRVERGVGGLRHA